MGKYIVLGLPLNQQYRNDLNKNFDDVDVDLKRVEQQSKDRDNLIVGTDVQEYIDDINEVKDDAIQATDDADTATNNAVNATNELQTNIRTIGSFKLENNTATNSLDFIYTP